MSKKRTRKQKELASKRIVNSQFPLSFNPESVKVPKRKRSIDKDKTDALASIRIGVLRSLIVAILCLIALVVLYWFS